MFRENRGAAGPWFPCTRRTRDPSKINRHAVQGYICGVQPAGRNIMPVFYCASNRLHPAATQKGLWLRVECVHTLAHATDLLHARYTRWSWYWCCNRDRWNLNGAYFFVIGIAFIEWALKGVCTRCSCEVGLNSFLEGVKYEK